MEKDPAALTDNERGVLDEIARALPVMNAAGKQPTEAGDRYKMPAQGKSFLSYPFLEALLRASNNPDFLCGKLPRQAAQAVLKDCVQEMKSYYAAKREYKRDPGKFRGEPKFPGYNKPSGCCTTTLTNQDCILYDAGRGVHELKLPLTRERLSLGKAPIQGRLKQVKVIPTHGIFVISLTTEVKGELPEPAEVPQRIIGTDLGVNNFSAITNNLGKPCLLFKGGVAKSANQWYNKQMAALVSEQTSRTGAKFVPTPEARMLELRRDNYLRSPSSSSAGAWRTKWTPSSWGLTRTGSKAPTWGARTTRASYPCPLLSFAGSCSTGSSGWASAISNMKNPIPPKRRFWTEISFPSMARLVPTR